MTGIIVSTIFQKKKIDAYLLSLFLVKQALLKENKNDFRFCQGFGSQLKIERGA